MECILHIWFEKISWPSCGILPVFFLFLGYSLEWSSFPFKKGKGNRAQVKGSRGNRSLKLFLEQRLKVWVFLQDFMKLVRKWQKAHPSKPLNKRSNHLILMFGHKDKFSSCPLFHWQGTNKVKVDKNNN